MVLICLPFFTYMEKPTLRSFSSIPQIDCVRSLKKLLSRKRIHSNYVKKHSAVVESFIDPLVKSRFEELVNPTPKLSELEFKNGFLKRTGDKITWRKLDGKEITLVETKNLAIPEGHSISDMRLSPRGDKIAFATTYQGQDLKLWNLVTIEDVPKLGFKKPAENRMQGFSWDKEGEGIYFSYWHPKEEVEAGRAPILDHRYRRFGEEKDTIVLNHGLAENFEIADLDNGNTLLAYRLLARGSGIKTHISIKKGIKQADGSYIWTETYPRNKDIGFYIGTFEGKALIHTSGEGDHYGISMIDAINGKTTSLIPARKDMVLHESDLIDDKLVLQYHSIPEQHVTILLYDLKTKSQSEIKISELGLTPFGSLSNFSALPGARNARAKYSDVMSGDHAIDIDLKTGKITKLENSNKLNFDASKVSHRQIEFIAKDGTKITGRLFTRNGEEPKFVMIRYYGWISIKNSPEPREVQMALESGGAYLTLDLPGGGERGAEWFLSGSADRLSMIDKINEASDHLQKLLKLSSDKVVVMGRSWGGLTSLILAAKHGENFGIINPVVPVIDLEDALKNGWFGRIAHSDLAPLVDENGNYILDESFQAYVESINPIRLISEIKPGTRIHAFTNGLDDRVDQGGAMETSFFNDIETQIGSDFFRYHRSIKGSHSTRFYQVLMFSQILDHYNLDYRPLTLL